MLAWGGGSRSELRNEAEFCMSKTATSSILHRLGSSPLRLHMHSCISVKL